MAQASAPPLCPPLCPGFSDAALDKMVFYDEAQQLEGQQLEGQQYQQGPGAQLVGPAYGGGPGFLAATAAVSAFVPILTVYVPCDAMQAGWAA